jgi:Glycosyl transferase family 2
LSSGEMRQKLVRLGSSLVAVAYPPSLDVWFDGLVDTWDKSIARRKWVSLNACDEPSRFDVVASVGPPAARLDLGDALASFWERVSVLLIDDLRDALVLHAAALDRGNGWVLLPGPTGCGKTQLSLWYRERGFELATDEVVAISRGPNDFSDGMRCAALARPVMLKSLADRDALLLPGEVPVAQQDSSYGVVRRLAGANASSERAIDRGLIVFPHFKHSAPFELSVLTPGETCLNLIQNCLNVRNLPHGGLRLASLLARRVPAIALIYGETSQLEGTLDVLTRQVMATPTSGDLGALCAAFTAAASVRTASTTTTSPVTQVLESPKRTVPAPTAARFPRRLTIGMATYDDYDGVYFTVQSIRINNPEIEGAVEFVVIDNNPGGPCSDALSQLGKWVDGYRYIPRGEWSGTAIRNAVFEEASSPFVLCVDSHVLIVPNALSKLIDYFEADPDSRDLVQGPMVYDDLRKKATHMEPSWRAGMYGTWASDPRGTDPSAPGFEIPLHGLGLFGCCRAAWAGFNPKFRGFGGEEGYIHEKMRQRGGRTLCLPFLQWMHRFNRPWGASYLNRWEDRIRNYVIGFVELGLDTAEMEAHFAELLGAETAARIFTEIKRELV